MVERLNLKPPSRIKQILEHLGIEVTPVEICSSQETLDRLYEVYPDLAGDRDSTSDECCQSWRGQPGWWKELVRK